MKRELELADIQGIVINGYARSGFPKARHLFLHVANPVAGRRFITQIFSSVTTSVRWSQDPPADGAGVASGSATVRPKVKVPLASSVVICGFNDVSFGSK